MPWPLISCFTCFSACRTQIILLPCFIGHFVKLCYLYKSFEVFDWWYYKVQSINVSTQNIVYYFITSKYNCIHTHSIPPPPKECLSKTHFCWRWFFDTKNHERQTRMARSYIPFLTISSSGRTNNFPLIFVAIPFLGSTFLHKVSDL